MSPTSGSPSGAVGTALGRFGELDVLVNDAAAYPDAALVDMEPTPGGGCSTST